MSIYVDRFRLYTPDNILCAVRLSVRSCVGGCGCPMSSRVRQIVMACWAFINRPATSDYVADDITCLMIFAST